MEAETFRISIPVKVEDQTEPGVSNATKKMTAFDRQNEKTQKRLEQLNRTRYEVAVEALDKASSVIGRIGTSLKGIAGKAWRITMNVLDKATAPIRGVINLLKNPILQAGALIGVGLSTADAVKTFADFQAGMNEVFTLSPGISEQAMRDMENDLKTLAKKTGIDLQDTVSAAYQAVSAGVGTDDLSGFLDTASKAAIGGVTDLETAVDGLTSVINAYGKDTMSAGTASDLMFTTVRLGKTTFGELADSLFNVVPTAVGAGVAFSDVSAALAAMTAQGIPTSVATTQLRQAIVELSKSGTDTDKTFRTLAGKGFKDFIAGGGNLQQAFQILEDHAASTGLGINDLFGSVEAGNAVLALTGTGTEAFTNAINEMADAAGATDAAFKTVDKGLARFMSKAKSTVQVLQANFMKKFDPLFTELAGWFEENTPALEKAVDEISTVIADKITWLKDTIREFTSGEDWENADIWGKIKIAWDKIVAEPFSQWWSSTGKAWFADKAASIGQGIGSGITTGLLALLGIDINGAAADGKSVGSSFIQGFKQGFDTEKIGEALKTWASNNKEIVVGLGVILGGKLIAGIAKGVRQGKNLYNDLKSILGKGSNSSTPGTGGGMVPSTYTTTTMTVTASVVNVYGNSLNNGRLPNVPTTRIPSVPQLPSGGAPMRLPGPSPTLALPGAAGGGEVVATVLKNGHMVVGTGGAITEGLATIGTSLGSGATTMGGAAAVGGGSILGAIGGLAGIGSGIWDFFKGSKKEGKEAKDDYFSGGTKIGMVGAGAGIGAGIGALFGGVGAAPGALIGAGIGGIASLFKGSDIGKWLSDATDEGGWLNNTGKAISKFFTTTLPEKWNSFWGGVGDFFTSTVPEWWGNLTDAVGSFFTETIPEKWGEFWEGVGNFFTETIPYAIGYAAGKIEVFFTEDIPEFFGNLWDGISTFFTSTLPTWASDVWNNKIVPFFTESIPTFFGNLWDSISTFFTSTLPTWASDVWNNKIVPFFTESIPTFFGNLWDGISTFFTSTLPTWASDTWNNNIVPFFTESIPGFFKSLWDGVTGFFTETLPELASSIWGSIKGFFTDTLPNFFKDVWGSITSFFNAGYSDAKSGDGYGASTAKHAYGGIMTKPHMGIVAEDGPESIIPLEPGKRARGIDLWEETGRNLGVMPYADGGIVGDTDEAQAAETIPLTSGGAGSTGAPNIFEIEVKVNPEFVIQSNEGMDEESIVAIIKARIKEMVDDIGDELAERLARIFANTPVKGGA